MRDIVSREKNYANFRSYLHNVNPPCIPYLGIFFFLSLFLQNINKKKNERLNNQKNKSKECTSPI